MPISSLWVFPTLAMICIMSGVLAYNLMLRSRAIPKKIPDHRQLSGLSPGEVGAKHASPLRPYALIPSPWPPPFSRQREKGGGPRG